MSYLNPHNKENCTEITPSLESEYYLTYLVTKTEASRIFQAQRIIKLNEQKSYVKEIDSNKYCCKMISKNYYNKLKMKEDMINKIIQTEIDIHSQLNHHNIVKFFNSFSDSNRFYIILEYHPYTLEKIITTSVTSCLLSGNFHRSVFSQICSALTYLHENNIIHGDIKDSNILISNVYEAKICDFGLSINRNLIDNFNTVIFGTPYYMAPEMLDRKLNYDNIPKIDSWSLGIVLYRMLYKIFPFNTVNKSKMILQNAIRTYEPGFPTDLLSLADVKLKDICYQLLIKDSNLRPFVKDLIL